LQYLCLRHRLEIYIRGLCLSLIVEICHMQRCLNLTLLDLRRLLVVEIGDWQGLEAAMAWVRQLWLLLCHWRELLLGLGLDLLLNKLLLWHRALDLCLRGSPKCHALHSRDHGRSHRRTCRRGVCAVRVSLLVWGWLHLNLRLLHRRLLHRLWREN
jgi:hypothetical protein